MDIVLRASKVKWELGIMTQMGSLMFGLDCLRYLGSGLSR